MGWSCARFRSIVSALTSPDDSRVFPLVPSSPIVVRDERCWRVPGRGGRGLAMVGATDGSPARVGSSHCHRLPEMADNPLRSIPSDAPSVPRLRFERRSRNSGFEFRYYGGPGPQRYMTSRTGVVWRLRISTGTGVRMCSARTVRGSTVLRKARGRLHDCSATSMRGDFGMPPHPPVVARRGSVWGARPGTSTTTASSICMERTTAKTGFGETMATARSRNVLRRESLRSRVDRFGRMGRLRRRWRPRFVRGQLRGMEIHGRTVLLSPSPESDPHELRSGRKERVRGRSVGEQRRRHVSQWGRSFRGGA